jgi:hypothetical protein
LGLTLCKYAVVLLIIMVCAFWANSLVQAADTVKPTVNLFIGGIETPHNTAVSGESTTITADASDDMGVTKVEFYIDDALYFTDTVSPYSSSWVLGADNMTEGPHTISAIVYDAAGNVGFDEFTQTVFNNHFTGFSCAGSPLLICQDFEGSAGTANFTTSGGTWTMSGNLYSIGSPAVAASGNGNLAIHNTSVPGDFTLRAQGAANNPDPDFSVVWGYQNANNYYYASFSQSNNTATNGVFKVVGGVITELANFTTTIADAKRYKVKVEKTGSTYRVYRNNSSMAVVTDSSLGAGRIGLGSRDNVVTFYPLTLESGTPPVYVSPPSDITSPTVILVSPDDDATVSGSVPIRWGHVDNVAGANNAPPIADREVLVDGVPLSIGTSDSITWQSTGVSNGVHTITVNAHDAAGNLGSDSITVTVANETTPPVTSLTAPADGSIVSGTVAITANASDNIGVSKVEFYDNGNLVETDTIAPYSVSWSTVSIANGQHTLSAKAYDAAGNTAMSNRTVTVQNISFSPQGPFRWQVTGMTIMDEGKNAILPTDFLHKGERLFVSITGKNIGSEIWYRDGVNPARLGTNEPHDHRSPYCDVLWLSMSTYCNRAASLVQDSVFPGETFTYEMYIHAPNKGGEFREHFKPLLEGRAWMTNETGFHIYINSTDFYDWQWLYFDAWTDSSKATRVDMNNLFRNQQIYIELKVKNKSATIWRNSGDNPTRLGMQNPHDHNSFLCTPSWISCNRAANISESTVNPGQTATFSFTIKTPGTNGVFREYMKPVIEHRGWMRGDNNHIYMNVNR